MSTSLNQMVIKLGADTSGLSRGMKIAQRDVKRTNRTLQNARTDAEKYNDAARSLRKSLAVGHITNQQYAKGLEYLRNQYLRTSEAVDKTSNSLVSLAAKVASVATAFAMLRGAGGFISAAAEAEEAKVQLEVFSGSAKVAAETYLKLRALAAKTPITLRGVQDAAVRLMAYGISTQELLPTLSMLGDVSAGNSERFQFLARAYGQVAAAGRLMGQENLQLINAGFAPLKEMSKQTGESMGSLKKRMENGQISFAEFRQAMIDAVGEGGRFFEMMEKYARTFSGATTIFKSAIEEVKIDLGEKLLPALAAIVNKTTEVVKGLQSFALNLSKTQVQTIAAVAAFASVVVILPKVVAGVQLVIGAVRALIASQITLQAFSGPAGWAQLAAGAAAAAGAIYAVDAAYKSYIQSLQDAKSEESQIEEEAKNRSKIPQDTARQKEVDAAKELMRLAKERQALRLGQDFVDFNEFKQSGADPEQVKEYLRIKKSIKLIRERKKLEEEITKEQERRAGIVADLQKQGRSLTEKYNPVERVSTQLAELNRLLVVNAIDQATYFKERNKILAKEVTDYSGSLPSAMEYGSQSAAQAVQEKIAQDRAEQIAKLEAIRLLQEAGNRTQEKTNALLREIRPVRGARG